MCVCDADRRTSMLLLLLRRRLMQQAVQHFQQELAGVRTGRASPGLIENLPVDAEGDHVPVKACGTVTVRSPQLLAVVLFDPSVSCGAGSQAPA